MKIKKIKKLTKKSSLSLSTLLILICIIIGSISTSEVKAFVFGSIQQIPEWIRDGNLIRLRTETNNVRIGPGDGALFVNTNTGNVGIKTTNPTYTLDVNGTIRATKSLTAGINVETLSGNKTLTPSIDEMYQYLDPNGAHRTITLDTSNTKAGDRFIIRNNGAYDISYYLKISDGTNTLDYIYAGAIKKFIFDGTNWISAENGTGENDDKKYSVAIGYRANGYNHGVAIGNRAIGHDNGAAIGYYANGSNYGFAIGDEAKGSNYGLALGYRAKGFNYGLSLGYGAGYNLESSVNPNRNILIGHKAGYNLKTGNNNIFIGYDIEGSATDTDKLNIGNTIYGNLANGNVGIGTTTPSATLNVVAGSTSTIPTLITGAAATQVSDLFQVAKNPGARPAFVIDSKGNVGIGTTHPDPQAKLHIEGGDFWLFNPDENPRIIIGDSGATDQYGYLQWDSANSYYRIETDGANGLKIKGNNVAIGNIYPAQPLIVGSESTELFRIENNGNVGIGTANPNEKLEVNGGVRLNTTASKPSCDANHRGTLWFTQGGSGVKDTLEVCAKDESDTYSWRTIY